MAVSIFIQVEPITETVDAVKVVEAAGWRAPSRTFIPESEYRYMSYFGSDETSLEIGGDYENLFGVAPVGSLIPVRVRTLSIVSGLASSWLYQTAIVEV